MAKRDLFSFEQLRNLDELASLAARLDVPSLGIGLTDKDRAIISRSVKRQAQEIMYGGEDNDALVIPVKEKPL